MKSFKKWTKTVVWSVVILIGCVVSLNIVVDAFGILRSDFTRQFQVPNMNFIKMKYLDRNRNKYDSFIFGSSRVENIDQSKITNGRYYNMTYPLGLPEEHLGNISFLLSKGVPIKNIIIGIDEFSFLVDPEQRRSDLLAQPHPAVSGKPLHVFYGEYLLSIRKLKSQLKAYIEHNYTKKDTREENRIFYDMYDTGRIFCRGCDDEIERNRENHVRSLAVARPILVFDGNYVDRAIDALKEIVALSKKNNINLVIFINPIYQSQYLAIDLAKAAHFKRALAAITDYFDFSGLNSITTNGYYYYETVHYRPIVGDMILKVIFSAPDANVPRDFGSLVTPANVESHLRNQCFEIQQIRNKVTLTAANTGFVDSCDGPSSPVVENSQKTASTTRS